MTLFSKISGEVDAADAELDALVSDDDDKAMKENPPTHL